MKIADLTVDLLHTEEAKKAMRLLLTMKDDSNVPMEYRQTIEKMFKSKKAKRLNLEFDS